MILNTKPPVKGQKSRRFTGVIEFLVAGGLALFILVPARPAKAAPYSSPSTSPPQCSTRPNIPYPVDYYIDKANWGSNTALKSAVSTAYNQGAPAVIFFDHKQSLQDILYVVIFNTEETSSATAGVRLPNETNALQIRAEADVEGYIRFQMNVNESTGVAQDPPSFPGVFDRWEDESTPENYHVVPGITSGDDSDDDCIYGVQNIYLWNTLDFMQLSEHEAEAENPERGFWASVTGFFGDIWEWLQNLPQMVIDLFVPDSETIGTITGDFTEFMSEKMGFLLWPFDFIADIIGVFSGTGISDPYDEFGNPYNNCADESWNNNSSVSPWSFGQFFGGSVRINPCAFEKTMPAIWTFAQVIARALLVYAVVNRLLQAHRRIVQS